MPPRMAPARQTAKRQQNQQQNQDRGSPATSLDASVSNGKNANTSRNVINNTTANAATNGNSRKRGAQAMTSDVNQANKRKKIEGNAAANGGGPQESSATNNRGSRQGPPQHHQESSETEEPRFTVDFSTLPISTISIYLQKHDLVPPMYPPPNTQYIPPLPPHLLNPPPAPPQAHTGTPSPPLAPHLTMGRPKRDPKRASTNGSSRRSTRLAEDEFNQTVYGGIKEKLGKPILNDVLEAHKIYADLAKRHWDGIVLKESETIDAFSFAIRNKGRLLKSVT